MRQASRLATIAPESVLSSTGSGYPADIGTPFTVSNHVSTLHRAAD